MQDNGSLNRYSGLQIRDGMTDSGWLDLRGFEREDPWELGLGE